MNLQPLKREFRIVRSRAFADAMHLGAKPVDERQRDGRPGRYTVSGSFVQLPTGELPESSDDTVDEGTRDWRRA
jgi:hypothetical protein